MTRNIALANRIREVLLNGYWIANTNYKQEIQNTTWQQAVHKIGSLNTIAALTYHINYYLAGLLFAFKYGKLEISDKYSFDLPTDFAETDWIQLITAFLNNAEKFASHVEQMDDSLFDKAFIHEKYGNYLRNIEGVIEHSYYHLGQIVLIKKMI